MGRSCDADIFKRVHVVASKSTMNQRHGAIIVKNGEIVGEGCNYTAKWMCHPYSVHAEVAALLSVPKRNRHRKYLEDSTMLVIRISGKDKHCNFSAPCDNCKKEIEKYGIKRVFYSISEIE